MDLGQVRREEHRTVDSSVKDKIALFKLNSFESLQHGEPFNQALPKRVFMFMSITVKQVFLQSLRTTLDIFKKNLAILRIVNYLETAGLN